MPIDNFNRLAAEGLADERGDSRPIEGRELGQRVHCVLSYRADEGWAEAVGGERCRIQTLGSTYRPQSRSQSIATGTSAPGTTYAPLSGKRSTPYGPGTVHDYMHAKVTVADDVVFVGSYNLSHSGQENAENVLEIHGAEPADHMAAFVDEIRARYPALALASPSNQA